MKVLSLSGSAQHQDLPDFCGLIPSLCCARRIVPQLSQCASAAALTSRCGLGPSERNVVRNVAASACAERFVALNNSRAEPVSRVPHSTRWAREVVAGQESLKQRVFDAATAGADIGRDPHKPSLTAVVI